MDEKDFKKLIKSIKQVKLIMAGKLKPWRVTKFTPEEVGLIRGNGQARGSKVSLKKAEKNNTGNPNSLKETIFDKEMKNPKLKAIYNKISKEIDIDDEKAKKRMINKEKERRVKSKQQSKKLTNEQINKIRQEALVQKYHTIPKSPVSIEKMNETIRGGWRKMGKTIFDKKMEDPKFKALFDREYARLEINESKAKRKTIKINKSIKLPK